VSGEENEGFDAWHPARRTDVANGLRPAVGPNTSSQLVALRQLESLSALQEKQYLSEPGHWQPVPVMPAASAARPAPPASSSSSSSSGRGGDGERVAGRHHASSSRGDDLLRRHGNRFASFSAIGGGIFVAGLVIQAVLTSGLHVSSLVSYVVQAVVSVEASYFLNRWVTWKKVKTPFWASFAKFNLQKVITVTLNLVLYGILVKLGMEYLLANILLTVVFTFVNYVGADRLVFLRGTKQMVAAVTGPLPMITGPMPVLRLDRQPAPRSRQARRELPTISIVIPVRGNEATIKAAVESVLHQDYPLLHELILVGSPGDSTWSALRGMDDPRLFVMETATPPGIRDANFKRDLGIRQTSGDLVSLIDSDMVIPPDWMSNAVRLLTENGVDCVAGVMRSIRDDFWGRFVDGNRLGAKTPRAKAAYLVTAEGFGAEGYKPPITADILFTRAMYEDCPIDGNWSHGSLEDYEWFWRVVERGHQVLVCSRLFGWHHHRAGMRNLAREYRRSARGCAYFIRAHPDSPFAQKRLSQAIVLPLAALGILLTIAAAAYLGHGKLVAAAVLAVGVAGAALLSGREFARTRTLESLLYPIPGLVLGLNYTTSLATHLVRTAPVMRAPAPAAQNLRAAGQDAPAAGRRQSRLPIAILLALQALCSLTLVWSNTAFGDEANYLSLGHLLVEHWLHGTPWPAPYGEDGLSGSPYIYPPMGAIASSFGGLAGARILSLIFMLGATVLLYSVAIRLYDQLVTIFATALWALSEPTFKLAFATFDALSVFLMALAAWLIVEAATRRRRGAFAALSALALGLSNATAYSGVVIDPVVLLFGYLVWKQWIGKREARVMSGSLIAVATVGFCAVMTVGHSWPGIYHCVFARNSGDQQTLLIVLNDVWAYSGLIIMLGLAGVVLAYGARKAPGARFGLSALLGLSVLIIPVAQLHEQTATSMDKHLAYGIWFASMAAGYALATAIRATRLRYTAAAAIAACTVAFSYPLISSWQAAWLNFHSWANATSYISAVKPVVAQARGNYYASSAYRIAEYYTPQGAQWTRWNTSHLPGLSSKLPPATWDGDLNSSGYGFFSLFYPTSSAAPAILDSLVAGQSSATDQALLELAEAYPSQPGLLALTKALESDPSYKLVAVGPYDSRYLTEAYAIWKKG
jgi:putative flippase GtrA/glycosyltransferase involved in cell wall biosynthesis